MTKPLVPVALAVVLFLAGCGGSSDEGASAPATSTASTADTAPANPSSTSSETPSETPSESSTPSVTPATGRTVETLSMTFQVPRDFKGGAKVGNGLLSSVNVKSFACVCQIFAGGLGNLNSEDLEGAAANVFKDRDGERQPDREVGGRQALFYIGEDKDFRTYTVASIAGDQIATFAMQFTTLEGLAPQGQTPQSEQALLDSILATVQWKE